MKEKEKKKKVWNGVFLCYFSFNQTDNIESYISFCMAVEIKCWIININTINNCWYYCFIDLEA